MSNKNLPALPDLPQPLSLMSFVPVSPGFVCRSRERYSRARLVFHEKWKSRRRDRDIMGNKYLELEMASLHNLLVCHVKLGDFTCLDQFCGELEHHPHYFWVRFIQVSSEYLRGTDSMLADHAFRQALAEASGRMVELQRSMTAIGALESMLMVHFHLVDCLVLRPSEDSVLDLLLVNDYTAVSFLEGRAERAMFGGEDASHESKSLARNETRNSRHPWWKSVTPFSNSFSARASNRTARAGSGDRRSPSFREFTPLACPSPSSPLDEGSVSLKSWV